MDYQICDLAPADLGAAVQLLEMLSAYQAEVAMFERV
jgi:hypothetical protein